MKSGSSVEMMDKSSEPAITEGDDTMHPSMSLGAFFNDRNFRFYNAELQKGIDILDIRDYNEDTLTR